jgi:hypothetical protein
MQNDKLPAVNEPKDDGQNDGDDDLSPAPSKMELEDLPSNDEDVIVNCFHQLKVHARVIQNLHLQCSLKPIPEGNVDFITISKLVSVWTTPEVAQRIVCCLQKHFAATDATLTRFRASIVYSMTDDEIAWPVVEWTENDDTEVIAIFYIDEDAPPEVCSWLMHYGVGILEDSKNGMRWEKTYISWNVGGIDHLQLLFEAAQQLLGILRWSPQDILQLYCKRDLANLSSEEYFPPCLIRLIMS